MVNRKPRSSDKKGDDGSEQGTERFPEQLKRAYQWGVIKYIDKQGVLYRLVSASHDGEAAIWSLNSGILRFKICDGYVDFYGFSGSIYRARFQDQGFSQQMLTTILGWRTQECERGNSLDLMPFALFLKEWKSSKPGITRD